MKEGITDLKIEIKEMEEYITELEECPPKQTKVDEKKCSDFYKNLTGRKRDAVFSQLKNLVAPKVIIRYKLAYNNC